MRLRVVEANAATVSEESLLLIVYCVHPCKLPRLPTGVNVELVYLGALVTSIYRIVEWIGGIGDVYELRLSVPGRKRPISSDVFRMIHTFKRYLLAVLLHERISTRRMYEGELIFPGFLTISRM